MCDCSIGCSFSREEQRTARKEYCCGECNKAIPIGTKYVYWVGKCDGSFSTFRMCLGCHNDWDTLEEILYGAGLHWSEICTCLGELRKEIDRAVDEGYLERNHPLAYQWLGVADESEDLEDWEGQDYRQLELPFRS